MPDILTGGCDANIFSTLKTQPLQMDALPYCRTGSSEIVAILYKAVTAAQVVQKKRF